jgi:hypothetical protein
MRFYVEFKINDNMGLYFDKYAQEGNRFLKELAAEKEGFICFF